MHRFIFSILLVLAGSFLYDYMKLDMVFKGIIANDDIVIEPENQVSSVAKVKEPFALDDKFAYSESFSREALANDLNRKNMFIGDNYKDIR